MAHFAKIDENNKVIDIVVIPNEFENRGQDYLNNDVGMDGRWIQTSYNTLANKHKNNLTPLRGNYAGIGYTYDSDFDVFIPPQPYPSWKLDYTTFQWLSPIPMPQDIEGYVWRWSEINKEWIKVVLPTE